jgi:L-rhamnose mutarotase
MHLPIGSGEVESAHRYLIQKRLKLPGAWWCADNAQAMLNLRSMRANQRWDCYWKSIQA